MRNVLTLKDKFEQKHLIYKYGHDKNEPGSITLGWRFEFFNKLNGELSGEIDVSPEEVYKGLLLDEDKKNAFIKGKRVSESGIANYLLFVDDIAKYKTAQIILDDLTLIDTYLIEQKPKIYFACKALNYRTLNKPPKWEGNRHLSVYVNWSISDGKLKHELIFNNPLLVRGNQVAETLKKVLSQLKVVSTCNLDEKNVHDFSIVSSI